ncbi:MAG TPA: hypothetical protein PKD66_09515 [Azonexus sp.]|nr:hypothetical protein [Azonexus sp.]
MIFSDPGLTSTATALAAVFVYCELPIYELIMTKLSPRGKYLHILNQISLYLTRRHPAKQRCPKWHFFALCAFLDFHQMRLQITVVSTERFGAVIPDCAIPFSWQALFAGTESACKLAGHYFLAIFFGNADA